MKLATSPYNTSVKPSHMSRPAHPSTHAILTVADIDTDCLRDLLARYGLQLESVSDNAAIPGSFWGDSEAGLIDNRLLARGDTPVHSILHEACHYICMDGDRRRGLHTNAGGDYDEENAVCYLQILLAAQLPDVGSGKLMQDMDAWDIASVWALPHAGSEMMRRMHATGY